MFFGGSFSTETRLEIKDRSEGRSELSGKEPEKGEQLVCAHLNHDKDHPDYDKPEMGLRVTKEEEMAYHQMHLFCPEKIGMDEMQNKSVVASYMAQFCRQGMPLEEVREKVGEAIGLWLGYLEGSEGGPEASNPNETPREAQTPTVEIKGLKNSSDYAWKDDSYSPPPSFGKKKPYIPGGL